MAKLEAETIEVAEMELEVMEERVTIAVTEAGEVAEASLLSVDHTRRTTLPVAVSLYGRHSPSLSYAISLSLSLSLSF